MLSGKILRMNLDGGVPADNPYPDSLIWSYGHRNPQGLVLAGNGKLYSSEHGLAYDDELNLIEKGGNYGWPNVAGICDTPQHYGQRLQQLRLDASGEHVIGVKNHLVNTFGRLREVMASPDGRVFIFTSNWERNRNKPRLERPGDDKLIMLRNPKY